MTLKKFKQDSEAGIFTFNRFMLFMAQYEKIHV